MTTVLEYTLTPRNRLSPGSGGQVVNERPAHDVIPGSTVRGALGSTWWHSPSHGYEGSDSQHTFDAFFGHGLEVRAAAPTGARFHPLADFRCKYPEEDCVDKTMRTRLSTRERLRCNCGAGVREGRGWTAPRGAQLAVTRTALRDGTDADGNRGTAAEAMRGTADEGMLYSRMALRAKGTFTGTLVVRDAAPPEAVEWLRSIRTLRVGGQRSTMGECSLALAATEAAPTPIGHVVVALRSPAVLLDEYGAPSFDLASEIARVIDRPVDTDAVWVRPVLVSGWHGVAGILKPQDWGVAAGSCAVVGSLSPAEGARLREGLGIRRLEGHGEVELLSVADEVAR